MGVDTESRDTVRLVPDNLTKEQDVDMHMFEITLWNLDYNDNGLRVSIVMRRKVNS